MLLFNKNLNNKNKNKNKNIGPMDITNEPWLYFKRDNIQSNPTSKYGKYILWYDVKYMNYMWNYAKQLFNDGLLEEIEYIKCTTSYAYPNNSYEFEGSIMLYCNLFNKNNDDTYDDKNIEIKKIGEKIIKLFKYTHKINLHFKINVRENRKTMIDSSSNTIVINNNLFKNYCKLCNGILISEVECFWNKCNKCMYEECIAWENSLILIN